MLEIPAIAIGPVHAIDRIATIWTFEQYELNVMKNITLSAEESLIEAARERARSENTTLNEQFRRWLVDYAHARERIQRYDEVMAQLRGSLSVGRKLGREEMNER